MKNYIVCILKITVVALPIEVTIIILILNVIIGSIPLLIISVVVSIYFYKLTKLKRKCINLLEKLVECKNTPFNADIWGNYVRNINEYWHITKVLYQIYEFVGRPVGECLYILPLSREIHLKTDKKTISKIGEQVNRTIENEANREKVNRLLRTMWFWNEIEVGIAETSRLICIKTHSRLFNLDYIENVINIELGKEDFNISRLLTYHILHVPYHSVESLSKERWHGNLLNLHQNTVTIDKGIIQEIKEKYQKELELVLGSKEE